MMRRRSEAAAACPSWRALDRVLRLVIGTRSATAVTDTISKFFIWWFGELANCVPARAGELLRRRSAVLMLVPDSESVAFTLDRGGTARDLGRIRLDMLDERLTLAPLLRGISLRDVEIVMNLPADQVLRRRVALPLATQENLREVLTFEMDRHTPFKAGDVAFDYRVVSSDRETKQLDVDLAVVPRGSVEQACGLAEFLGLALDRIGITGETSPEGRQFNLLSRADPNAQQAPRNRPLVAVAVLAVALALLAVYLPLHAKKRTLAAYEGRLAEAHAGALEAEQLKERLGARVEHGRFLVDRRLSIPVATALLAELTRRLPDNTWLVQLRWQGDKLTIAGLSPAAAALIAGLEESPLLSEVRFGSPVTADASVGNERFNILANVSTTLGE